MSKPHAKNIMKIPLENIRLQFDLSDQDISKIVSESIPPKGIQVGKPSVIMKAGLDTGGVFS